MPKAQDPPAGSLPRLRHRRWLWGNGPAVLAGKGRQGSMLRKGGHGNVFAATIFDNRNDFQQPRLPVLTIWGLRNGALGL